MTFKAKSKRTATDDELRFQSCQFAHLDPEYAGWARERTQDNDGARAITRRETKYVAPNTKSAVTVPLDDDLGGIDG